MEDNEAWATSSSPIAKKILRDTPNIQISAVFESEMKVHRSSEVLRSTEINCNMLAHMLNVSGVRQLAQET